MLFTITGLVFVTYTLHAAYLNLLWVHNVREAVKLMNENIIWSSVQSGNTIPKKKEAASSFGLDTAITYLTYAQQLQGHSVSTYYLTGVVYAAQQNWQRAVESFAYMYSISSNPQLPGWASLLADEWLGKHFRKLEPLYKADGFNSLQLEMLQSADKALLQRNFTGASQLYQTTITELLPKESPDIPVDLLFRSTIAAALSSDKNTEKLLELLQSKENSFFVPTIVNPFFIEGGQLRWMTPADPPTVTFGTKLNFPYGGEVGTMWWAGQAVSLIFIPESGSYSVVFKLLNKGVPIELIIGVDGAMLQSVTLGEDDEAAAEAKLEAKWCKGFHTINIWFLNNDGAIGIEKDAFIESVSVSLQSANSCNNNICFR
jgi:hypothetical protein